MNGYREGEGHEHGSDEPGVDPFWFVFVVVVLLICFGLWLWTVHSASPTQPGSGFSGAWQPPNTRPGTQRKERE